MEVKKKSKNVIDLKKVLLLAIQNTKLHFERSNFFCYFHYAFIVVFKKVINVIQYIF